VDEGSNTTATQNKAVVFLDCYGGLLLNNIDAFGMK
jgi:hypothetical protein